jgi:hypothetical protein
VWPIYTGAVFEIVKVFEVAKEQVSVNGPRAMLRKLNFAYPYQAQAVSWSARATVPSLDLIRSFPMEHDFYPRTG